MKKIKIIIITEVQAKSLINNLMVEQRTTKKRPKSQKPTKWWVVDLISLKVC